MPAHFILIAAATLAAPPPADPLVGRWHGTSLCQVKPSPCHDEEAVYHISRSGGGHYTMVMNKIVAGAEQEMGTVDATYIPSTATLTAVTHDRSGRPGRWTFQLHGDRLSGRLVIGAKTLFRLIEVRREPAP